MLRLQMKYIFKFCHINRVGQYFRFSLATRGQRRQWRRKEQDVFLPLILVIGSQPSLPPVTSIMSQIHVIHGYIHYIYILYNGPSFI